MIIGDSSALIALSYADCLEFLVQRFGKVYVPQAVYDEITALPKNHALALKNFLHDKVMKIHT